MLARRLTTTLPAMTLAEALDTTRIHSVAGRTGRRTAVVTTRSYRAPHHTISDVGLIGGGQVPTQGEVSRAHHGMHFLDELPECGRHALEVLPQPLETGIPRGHPRKRPQRRPAGGAPRMGDAHAARHGGVSIEHSRKSARSPQALLAALPVARRAASSLAHPPPHLC
jgi:hypothetical protein